MYTLHTSSITHQDIRYALIHYQGISQKLVEQFLEILDQTLEKLQENPQHYSFFGDSDVLRRIPFVKFPYSFVYEIKADEIFIIGLFNQHQDPETILKRI